MNSLNNSLNSLDVDALFKRSNNALSDGLEVMIMLVTMAHMVTLIANTIKHFSNEPHPLNPPWKTCLKYRG